MNKIKEACEKVHQVSQLAIVFFLFLSFCFFLFLFLLLLFLRTVKECCYAKVVERTSYGVGLSEVSG